jgi:hypothetical protein
VTIETVVLVLVVVIVVGTARVVVLVTYLGKTSKVIALVATMARTQNKKPAKALTLILSSRKTLHPTVRVATRML